VRSLKSILVGTDFTPISEAPLRSAAHLARRYQVPIHLVAVVSPPPVYRRALAPLQGTSPTVEEMLASARGRLENLARSAPLAGLHVDVDARTGAPFSELIDAARTAQASLIAVGTRKHHGLEERLLGSTTDRVIRRSPIPVLAAPVELSAEPTCLVAPVDFSSASRWAAEEAIALARRWIARLIFLHVIEPIAQTYLWPLDPGAVEIFPAEPADLGRDWEEFLAPLALDGVRWEHRTLKGDPPTLIHETARDEGADLIAIGTHGRAGLAHALLGSVAERVVRTTVKPVLTIRPDADQFSLP